MYKQASSRASRAVLLLLSKRTTRHFSNEQSNHVRNYLDAWVGSTSSSSQTKPSETIKASQNARTSSKMTPPLLLSGSSYLIPTLRIERSDTPKSLSTRISAALGDSSYSPNSTSGVAKSMLRGKTTTAGRWQAPIILDLQALVPDGSPHYTPPQRGLLAALVKVLGEYNICVVGVTNTPPILEEEAVQKLGLPAFRSKGRVLDRQSATSKVNVEDVVKMLLIKSQEEINEELENEEAKPSETASGESLLVNDMPVPEATSVDDDSVSVPIDNAETATANLSSEDNGDDNNDTAREDSESLMIPTPAEEGTYVYHGSVRSGQQVAAPQNQSLIVIGSVNSGGEVMSDKDIFVFGKLRGRALGGLATKRSRIFATSFDPELICIGDTFTTVDTVSELGLDRPGEAAMVTLDSNGELVFEHIPL